MSDWYLGEIRAFPYSAAATLSSWMPCDGQLLQITQNQGLYSLIGNTYGGDGFTTFGLPDLRGRVPLGSGTFMPGVPMGQETVILSTNQVPPHSHDWNVSMAPADTPTPRNGMLADTQQTAAIYATSSETTVTLALATLDDTGIGQAHPNMQPFTVMTYYIAVKGPFPSRPTGTETESEEA
ncbi:tail fiber protein [Sphingomonas sp. AOB5]|uniref:phage tail protein n=1 Tax=Sphingomonas sp. AOB5 TaxID=3034017 RepID=UPI0023F8EB5B|nr:tail fiber protein [Sphingomonas sp. AOB5]MDF7775937.1 tail fiber protein [Sphingomonas sp. AOB5]